MSHPGPLLWQKQLELSHSFTSKAPQRPFEQSSSVMQYDASKHGLVCSSDQPLWMRLKLSRYGIVLQHLVCCLTNKFLFSKKCFQCKNYTCCTCRAFHSVSTQLIVMSHYIVCWVKDLCFVGGCWSTSVFDTELSLDLILGVCLIVVTERM